MAIGNEIALGLRLAYWPMHRRTNLLLASHGVTADQFVILGLLQQEDGITQQALCSRACSDPNTIRAMLVLLEKNGLIARATHATDKRARCVTITPEGKKKYARLVAAVESLQQKIAGLFKPQEAQALVDGLDRISKALT